jgi:hypothetical protein
MHFLAPRLEVKTSHPASRLDPPADTMRRTPISGRRRNVGLPERQQMHIGGSLRGRAETQVCTP